MSADAPNDSTAPTGRNAPRWMKILLALSLMLNVIGIGAVGAKAWMAREHGHFRHGMHGLGLHSFLRELSGERREKLRDEFGKRRGDRRRHRLALVAPMKDLANALSASNFSRAQVREAVAALRKTHESRAMARETLLLDFVDALSAEERRMFARSILEHVERHEKRRRKFRN